MADVTTASDAPARATRRWSASKALDLLIALSAHALVGLAWVVTVVAVMGSLGVLRRIPMNSEFAWDTGRLPQPWVIPLGLAAAWIAHRFFRWAMARYTRAEPAYGPSVVAWAGALLGVLAGVYFWVPPVQVGVQVGPASGQATPWTVVGWAAYYARLWLPGAIGLVTLVLLFFSKNSPLVVFVQRFRRPRRIVA